MPLLLKINYPAVKMTELTKIDRFLSANKMITILGQSVFIGRFKIKKTTL